MTNAVADLVVSAFWVAIRVVSENWRDIIPVFSLASGVIGAALVPWFQERRRVRREHFDAIKARVLAPLKKEFESSYLPLLEGKQAPVTVEVLPVRTQGSLSTSRTISEYALVAHKPSVDERPQFFNFVGAEERADD